MQITYKAAHIEGLSLRYLESQNSPGGTPLLILTGWPASSYANVPLMKILGEKIHSYALDLPGYGGSTSEFDIYHSFDYYATIIHAFQEQVINRKKVHLFGYSIGGVHGINYTARFPGSVDKLLIFSAPCNGKEYFKKLAKERPSWISFMNLLEKNPELIKVLDLTMCKKMLTLVMLNSIYKPDKNLSGIIGGTFVKRVVEESMKSEAKALFDTALDLSKHDFTSLAQKIPVETLVLSASNDRAVDPHITEKLVKKFPHGTFYMLPNAEHKAIVLNTAELAYRILSFIK